ncbi:TATA-binding protein-associated factor 172 [Hypsibius exemplaris]|uniref:TATA-binding protein-associated factor 172 n=1 Tax=Hypsibius exemplaris TaxID=2072580 RepID=A0A9X6NCM5_HYPEX|nr:TATA-binding protein-associated factor 172 [Hypsibius exemplaris]
MATRLDRLFALLESGSNAGTRRAAATQLGDVQKIYPHELKNLLHRLLGLLRSPSWDTRVAAGQGLSAVAQNVPQWCPSSANDETTPEVSTGDTETAEGKMRFADFDVDRMIAHGAQLLGSEGKEYDCDSSSTDPNDAAAKRRILNEQMGLGGFAEKAGLGDVAADMIHDEDLVTLPAPESDIANSRVCLRKLWSAGPSTSVRERNRMKRKLKTSYSRSHSVEEVPDLESNGSVKKLRSVDEAHCTSDDIEMDFTESTDPSEVTQTKEWPFTRLLEELCGDLFHSDWRIRHGAATGIREIVRTHGGGMGRIANCTVSLNARWLEDVALRLLCVLALDRFGDFVAYEVVAPVRETCAQALGAVVKWMPAELVSQVTVCLLKLIGQSNWQARHGGLLGLKYVLVVRQTLVSDLLPTIYPAVFGCLRDSVDDVCAVAASVLEAVMDQFLKFMAHEVPNVLALLWDGLLEFDDLTSWTNSFMSLLSTIVTKSEPDHFLATQRPLSELLPRLWPFLDHSSDRIRISVLQTVETLIGTASKTGGSEWVPAIAVDLMRRLYQRCILEERACVHPYLLSLWRACLNSAPTSLLLDLFSFSIATWTCLAMQAPSIAIDPGLFSITRQDTPTSQVNHHTEKQLFLAGSECSNDLLADRDLAVVRTRFLAAQFLALMAAKVFNDSESDGGLAAAATMSSLLQFHLKSKSAVQKFEAAIIVVELTRVVIQSVALQATLLDGVRSVLVDCLEETMPYDELALSITTMHASCVGLAQQLRVAGADLEAEYLRPVLTLRQCQALVSTLSQKALDSLAGKEPKVYNGLALLTHKRNEAATATQLASGEFIRLSSRVHLSFAAALVGLSHTPQKLAPLVRPLMDTLKETPNSILQDLAGDTLAQLMTRICRVASPTCEKIVKNLCSYLCCDVSQTPDVEHPLPTGVVLSDDDCAFDECSGIFSLLATAKEKEKTSSTKPASCSRKSSQVAITLPANSDASLASPHIAGENGIDIQRSGGECGLRAISTAFGVSVFDDLPQLVVDRILRPISVGLASAGSTDVERAKEVVVALQIVEKIIPHVHPDLYDRILGILDFLGNGVGHRFTAVRHMSGRVVASLALLCEERSIRFLASHVIPLLGSEDIPSRQGAIETVGCVIERLGIGVVPYIVLLTVPVMRRMTDQDEAVRLMASQCFGTLVRLMPLGMTAGAGKSPKSQWFLHKPEEVQFLEQLLDSSKMQQFVLPVKVDAELRSYQQDGLNWLNFLNRYNLHGILCDDMGLGKTLQSICILAADHFNRRVDFEQTKSSSSTPLPSLVICPATLIGHWAQEVTRFLPDRDLSALKYEGCPSERNKLKKSFKKYSLIISSYDIVKNDIDFLRDITWNYCVLDEGHVIRNNKTKVFRAIKQLVCNHRLILSGTPVQNNVQDLWALFDFLMPGLLGTEKKFASRFARAIEASKDPKATSQDIEEGALAMEALHKQVLPFILRRLKVDVLKDLPPKIIQDYYCDLTPIQLRLYEDFAKSKAQKDVLTSILGANGSEGVGSGSTGHVFQAFQYLRKVCNHPSLVLNKQHPQYMEITRDLERSGTSISDMHHAAKFVALQQLLLDCGIGQDVGEQNVVSSHRALIFCQLTVVLDLIENNLLRNHMPTVTFLKLDGSVPAKDRQKVVDRFNSDPSIDVLLLTTAIGGLGLNLTGADTVIFVEHDWNPSKDIQAMDRAHRIGQKKVVNVYRLITRGTIEEKIMGLQKFKLHMANSIITQQNSALQTMGTEQLVDLFSVESPSRGSGDSSSASGSSGSKSQTPKAPVKGLKAVLENLEDLWDSSQYDTEFDVGRFMDTLKK